MLTKEKKRSKTQVTFTMPAVEGCDCLYLVGEFNDWHGAAHPMQHKDDGTWSLTLNLTPGHSYQYRYLAGDGAWYNDPAADAYVPNPYGSDNSMVNT